MKFADLVRAYTTSTGVGAIVPGPTLQGFNSFTASFAPGDQFYYSILSLDHAAEKEVGIGTMNGDGSISRAPIGGATNFSAGTKTIAAVVGAAWFGATDAELAAHDAELAAHAAALGAIGSGAGLASDTDPTLAANSDGKVATQKATKGYVDGYAAVGVGIMALALFTSAPAKSVPVGVDTVRTNGYSTNGVGGAAYIYDAAVDAAYVTANPAVSFRTANGRGFRLVQNGIVDLEHFGGGTAIADNNTALTAAAAYCGVGVLIQMGRGQYNFSVINLPGATYFVGAGRNATTVQITGDGGGAAVAGANGGFQWFGGQCKIAHFKLVYNNSALQCLLNICPTFANGSGRNVIDSVDFEPRVGSAVNSNAIAVFLGNQVEFEWTQGQIGVSPYFKQCLKLGGYFNGCKVRGVTFQRHAFDLANGVYWDSLPQVDLNNSSTQGLSFDSCTWELGPNGIAVTGQGDVTIKDAYFGDGIGPKNSIGWLPNQAVARGDFTYPSANVTATSDGTTAVLTAVSSTASLYVGQLVIGVGMGAAGANLTARISAISGATVTLDGPTGSAVVGGGLYFAAYSGHGYRYTVAGTTGPTQPVWPTTFNGTIADGTATAMEYGSCAWININSENGATGKNATNIEGGYIATGICGVRGKRVGGLVGPINIKGVSFNQSNYCGRIDGPLANIDGNQFKFYGPMAFEIVGSSLQARGNYAPDGNGADFVISSSTASGSHAGTTVLTGVNASKVENRGATTYTYPGTFTAANVSGFSNGEWVLNFTGPGDAYIAAPIAMTIDQGNAPIGTGTLVFTKSTTAAPGTFGAAALPVTLQAGAWLKITASAITGFVATHLKRTA